MRNVCTSPPNHTASDHMRQTSYLPLWECHTLYHCFLLCVWYLARIPGGTPIATFCVFIYTIFYILFVYSSFIFLFTFYINSHYMV
jgi:hypothetical protein